MSAETAMSQQPTEDDLHDRADDFVSRLDRSERVEWLKSRGWGDRKILDALLDPEDPDLDEACRDEAHQVAADVANGATAVAPDWLS